MPSPLARVLDWLHAGYPDGVPPTDFTPLLALLRRTLSHEECTQIVEALIRENPDGGITAAHVEESIAQITRSAPSADDVREVASRLAAVGWPLSDSPDEGTIDEVARAHAEEGVSTPADGPEVVGTSAPTADAEPEPAPNPAQRMIAWLTEGYPDGIPATDRVPLMALLRRRLTDEELTEVASRLIDDARTGDIDTADAGTLITRYTDELPSEQDMARLASHLAARGWPLSDPA